MHKSKSVVGGPTDVKNEWCCARTSEFSYVPMSGDPRQGS